MKSKQSTSTYLAAATMLAVSCTAWAVDTDEDGIDDTVDNCSEIANADQRDTNGDGFGNACDTDLNDDNEINFLDLGMLRAVFFTDDADADTDGDGAVNFVDLGVMKGQFFQAPGPGAVPPAGFGWRLLRVEEDLDNNGQLDAVIDQMHTPEGRLLMQEYAIPGDGTPDLFSPSADTPVVRDFTYNPDGTLATLTQVAEGSKLMDTISTYSWNAMGQVERIDVEPIGGFPSQATHTTFVYQNGLRVQEKLFFTQSNFLAVIFDNTYDASGQIDTVTGTSVQPPDTLLVYDFDWAADGTVATIDRVFSFGSTEFVEFERAANGLDIRTTTGDFDSDAPFREEFFYAANGRLERVEFDVNLDGSVEAVHRYFWEAGPCEVFYLPDVAPMGGADGDPSTGVGDLGICAP